jgi:hypothetical protein
LRSLSFVEELLSQLKQIIKTYTRKLLFIETGPVEHDGHYDSADRTSWKWAI